MKRMMYRLGLLLGLSGGLYGAVKCGILLMEDDSRPHFVDEIVDEPLLSDEQRQAREAAQAVWDASEAVLIERFGSLPGSVVWLDGLIGVVERAEAVVDGAEGA